MVTAKQIRQAIDKTFDEFPGAVISLVALLHLGLSKTGVTVNDYYSVRNRMEKCIRDQVKKGRLHIRSGFNGGVTRVSDLTPKQRKANQLRNKIRKLKVQLDQTLKQ